MLKIQYQITAYLSDRKSNLRFSGTFGQINGLYIKRKRGNGEII